MFVISISLVQL